MEPRVTKREKKLVLTYELSSRIRCSAIYPQPAPNGSTIILYGHDKGLRVLWRGGRRLRQRSAHHDSEIIELDGHGQDESEAYDDEEEEMDTDCPHPSILHTLDLDLDSPVTKIAIPAPLLGQRTTGDQYATILAATLEGSIHVLSLPLAPLSKDNGKAVAASIVRKSTQIKQTSSYVRCLSAKILDEAEAKILVAAGSDQLEIWQLPAGGVKNSADVLHTVVPHSGHFTSISFHPAPRSRELVVTDKFGTVNAYGADTKKPLYTLYTPFEAQTGATPASPPRKRLLDSRFILGGRGIFAVLADGQWGIWDTSASGTDKSFEQFVLSGYLETAVASDVPEPAIAKKATSAFAPMTPNTRKVKSTGFFSAPQARTNHGAATGGISVSRTSSAAGVTDESVMIWHNNQIFSIPSIQSFWQRSTSGSSGLGTLYAPGIARIPGINLFNENITSVSQFAAGSSASGIGQLKIQRDFLVSAEHRFIIMQNRPGAASSFTQALAATTESKDQRMLDVGDLDLGGMDRILNNMDGRSRKVGFAH